MNIVYVAKNGSDENCGDFENPILSLDYAIRLFARIKILRRKVKFFSIGR